jgi:MFS family permease
LLQNLIVLTRNAGSISEAFILFLHIELTMDPNNPATIPALTVSDVLAQENVKGLGLTPELIRLYLVLAPATLVVCATNGFDGSVLNALQGIDEWKSQFGNPQGSLLGITSAAYALGAIGSTPFSAMVSDRFGRRWSIFGGSLIMMLGVIIRKSSA